MQRFILSILFLCFAYYGMAQSPVHYPPQPSAESKALKQTEMIVRELRISDTSQYHQLFDMHLRYARQHEKGFTRAQWLEEIASMQKDLQKILTKEQYEAFMNKQVNEGPHSPKPQVGHFGSPSGSHNGVAETSQPQPQPQPEDLP